MKMRIKSGDKVIVTTGKHKGEIGKVLKAYPSKGKLEVEGVNESIRNIKPNFTTPRGSRKQITRPIDVSNVAVVDDKNKPSRIGYKIDKDGKKVRVFKSSGKEL